MPKGFVAAGYTSISGESNKFGISGESNKSGLPHLTNRRPRKAGIAATLAVGLLLSGCASPIIGAFTIAEIGTIAGLVSSFMSGRDLTEHALSAATGKDCRILESILRPERNFCENYGSAATSGDFGGVMALLEGGNNTTLAQADIEVRRATNLAALGFIPIDRQFAVENFSLDIVHTQTAARTGHRISFGMLQASYGQSWSYELTAHRTPTREARAPSATEQVASAAPRALSATRSDGAVIVPQAVTR